MGEALAQAAVGIVALSATSLLIWLAANKLRSSAANSIWASEGSATITALLLVAGLILSGAQLVRGLLEVMPDPLVATAAGLIVSGVVPIIVCRLLDTMAAPVR